MTSRLFVTRLPSLTALLYLQLSKYFLVVLTERRRRRVNARAAVREGEGGDRHAEAAVGAGHLVVTVDDAAARDLRIGDRFAHAAHARGRHVARLQKFLPFVGGAARHDLLEHRDPPGALPLPPRVCG